MNEKVKEAQQKVVEFWKKYDKKQKTLIVSITAVVLITLIILAVVLTKPTYKELITCEDTVTAADITTALTGASIEYTTQNNNLTILVPEDNYQDAVYLIAQEGFTATLYTMEAFVADGSFSTTSEDRDRQWQKYLEDNMRKTLESFDFVKSAYVMFTLPKDKLTVLEQDEETYVSVRLELKKSMSEGSAEGMARFIATAVGNDTTNSITIIDTAGNTLFQGSDNYMDSNSLSVSNMDAIRDRFYNEVVSNVSKILSNTGLYTNLAVAPSLDISFDKVDIVDTEYYNPDEVLDNEYIYEQEGGNSAGGVPGTDSNDDDTTYMLQNADGTTSSVTINKNDYAVSSKITSTQGEQGKCNRETSTLSVTVNDYIYHDEAKLEESGVLDDMTWDEYIANNNMTTQLEIPEEIYELVAASSGIPRDNIHIYGSLIPMFLDAQEDSEFVNNILPIIVAIIILALLGFMVWRSLRPIEINEVEPELSVEELLSATRETQTTVEDIDLEEKSDTRKAIEKFVDENPEAAALLLRNWLNDDWG